MEVARAMTGPGVARARQRIRVAILAAYKKSKHVLSSVHGQAVLRLHPLTHDDGWARSVCTGGVGSLCEAGWIYLDGTDAPAFRPSC